jgi:peroxiredoxin Q/BCP
MLIWFRLFLTTGRRCMAGAKKKSIVTVATLKKACQQEIKSAMDAVQAQCQTTIAQMQTQIKKQKAVIKKAQLKCKATQKTITSVARTLKKKPTPAQKKRATALNKKLKTFDRELAQAQKACEQLEQQWQDVRTYQAKARARAAALRAFEQSYTQASKAKKTVSASKATSAKKAVSASKAKQAAKTTTTKAKVGKTAAKKTTTTRATTAKTATRASSTVKAPRVGDQAPTFETMSSEDQKVSLKSMQGQYVVLYFYPKDDTSGCTKQANEFSQWLSHFKNKNATVLGVSRDSMASHQRFKAKHQIKVPLIADENERLCQKYGVIKDKTMYGKKVRGIERSTFLIDRSGHIVRSWRGVKVPGHVEEVLAEIDAS